MGARGPRPQPTAVRDLHGNPGKRTAAGEEPRPGPAAPKMPRGLPREARAFWRRYAEGLAGLGLLTEVDAAAFQMMAMHWQVCQDAMREMSKGGTEGKPAGVLDLVATDEDGLQRKHPLLQVLRDNSSAFLRYAAHFGMSPSARAGMRVEPPAVVDPYEAFLSRKNGAGGGSSE